MSCRFSESIEKPVSKGLFLLVRGEAVIYYDSMM